MCENCIKSTIVSANVIVYLGCYNTGFISNDSSFLLLFAEYDTSKEIYTELNCCGYNVILMKKQKANPKLIR